MSEDEIEKICKRYGIKNWTLNEETGLVDVDDYVNLSYKKLTELPLNFGNVKGDFSCYGNNVTTLKGTPHSVGGCFHCGDNNLTSLEHCPTYTRFDFTCFGNIFLTSLKGLPKYIDGGFKCFNNRKLPIWEYRWILYTELGGDIVTGNKKLDTFLNNNKNPPKRDLPKLFTELKTLGDN